MSQLKPSSKSKSPSHRACPSGSASRLEASAGAHLLVPRAASQRAPPHQEVWQTVERSAWTAHQRRDWHEVLRILLQAYGPTLRQYCGRLVEDEALADDVYQTSLLQAFLHLPCFSGNSPFRVWLHAIARHRSLDALKSSRSQRKYLSQDAKLPEVATPHDTPEEALARKRTHATLCTELRRLPAPARQLLMLRYCAQLSYEELGRRCAEKPATLRVRVSRTLSRLRRGLESPNPSKV